LLKHSIKEIKIENKALLLGKRTLIMGILNATPDSFSDEGYI
jgi:dihydropteroate synthase